MNDLRKGLQAQELVQFRPCSQGAELAQFSEHELLKEGLVAQELVQLRPCSQGASVAQLLELELLKEGLASPGASFAQVL